MNSASLCSLAGRYENPIPPQCLAPIDFLKIPAQMNISIESVLYAHAPMIFKFFGCAVEEKNIYKDYGCFNENPY
jgi:hypothetical protein